MPQTSTETLPILPILFAGDPEVPGSAPAPADDDIIIKKPNEPGGDEPEGTPAPADDDIIIKGG